MSALPKIRPDGVVAARGPFTSAGVKMDDVVIPVIRLRRCRRRFFFFFSCDWNPTLSRVPLWSHDMSRVTYVPARVIFVVLHRKRIKEEAKRRRWLAWGSLATGALLCCVCAMRRRP